MNKHDYYDIYRRWKAEQSISEIAEQENRDRKTVRLAIQKIMDNGIENTEPFVGAADFIQ